MKSDDSKNWSPELLSCVDVEEYIEFAIRFCLGFYEKVMFYWNGDKKLVIEITHSFMSFLDGLDPVTRAVVQPSLGFVRNPGGLGHGDVTVILPMFGTSAITEVAESVVDAIHENPYFEGERHPAMSQEKFRKLREMTGL